MQKRCILFIILNFSRLFAQDTNIDILPIIDVSEFEKMVHLKGLALNNDETIHELNYLLVAIKQGEDSNLSTQKQEGKFVIESNQKITLSDIRLNINKGDEIKAYLFIRDDLKNQLIAKDSLFIKYDGIKLILNDYKKNQEKIEKEEFVLRGLVIDQTKTKLGKDFFDLFYSKYSLLNEMYPFIININEIPTMGRSFILQIEDGDNILHSFRMSPSEEYLTAQVEFILRRLNQYNNEKKFIKQQITSP